MRKSPSRQGYLRQKREEVFDSRYFGFLLAFLFVLCVIQGFLRFESIRARLNASIWLEGQPLAVNLEGLEQPVYPWIDPLALKDPGIDEAVGFNLRFIGEVNDRTWVLINGWAAKKIDPEDGVVRCKEGDLIQIIAEEGRINLVVSAVSGNTSFPQLGTWVKGKGILTLGRVKLAKP